MRCRGYLMVLLLLLLVMVLMSLLAMLWGAVASFNLPQDNSVA